MFFLRLLFSPRPHNTTDSSAQHAEDEFTFDLGDGGPPITLREMRDANPDLIVERRPSRRRRFWPFLLALFIALLLSLAVYITAQAQDVCDHHVTSGLLRHLINRGMAKAFFYGDLPDGRVYGILVVWNPSCQRALFSVYRTGPGGGPFKHVTHYYLSGARGTNLRSAIAAARARVDAVVVGAPRSGPPSLIYRAVPRRLGEPGFRPPSRGNGGLGGGGGLGGLGGAGGIRGPLDRD